MYTLKTSASFDSAHFLKGYEGKCSNIHGHRWTVEIEVAGESLDSEGQCRGMIVDFSTLKTDLGELVDYFDHSLIIEDGSLKAKTMEALAEEEFRIIQVDFRPTAENFAQYFYGMMTKKGYSVAKATVYETPNNCATYSE
jgi:6-pyruvoyltetrahydropterin/6-carboxytetrahydropterin synthase